MNCDIAKEPMRALRLLAGAFFLLAAAPEGALAAPETPKAPTAFFNDYAGLVPAERAQALNTKLRQFADETSTQILVTVFDRLPEDEVMEDFTARAAQAWRVGQKKLDNGAVLFVFAKDRKLRIEVGYGLEGALTDALSRRIISEAIVPRFRKGDWAGGLEAGADAMMAAVRGEYTAAPRGEGRPAPRGGLDLPGHGGHLHLHRLEGGARGADGRALGRTYSRRGSSPWIITERRRGMGRRRGRLGGRRRRRVLRRGRLVRGRRRLGELVGMDPREFVDTIDDARVVAAIQAAEARCRGEIRVHVTREPVGDAQGAAVLVFEELGMADTAERNGVLIYVSPRSQTFAVIGDRGIDLKCGRTFWHEVAEAMQSRLPRAAVHRGPRARGRAGGRGAPPLLPARRRADRRERAAGRDQPGLTPARGGSAHSSPSASAEP